MPHKLSEGMKDKNLVLAPDLTAIFFRPYDYYSHLMPTELESINLCNESVKELLASAEEEAQSFQNKATMQRMLTFLRADPEKSQASLMGTTCKYITPFPN